MTSLATRLTAWHSAVSRLCVPVPTDRRALYKEPPQRGGGAVNVA